MRSEGSDHEIWSQWNRKRTVELRSNAIRRKSWNNYCSWERQEMVCMWCVHGIGEHQCWRLTTSYNPTGPRWKWCEVVRFQIYCEGRAVCYLDICRLWVGKDDTKVFGLSNWKVRVGMNWNGEDFRRDRINGEDEEIRFRHLKLMYLSDIQVEILSKELHIKIHIKTHRSGQGSSWEIHIWELLVDSI